MCIVSSHQAAVKRSRVLVVRLPSVLADKGGQRQRSMRLYRHTSFLSLGDDITRNSMLCICISFKKCLP